MNNQCEANTRRDKPCSLRAVWRITEPDGLVHLNCSTHRPYWPGVGAKVERMIKGKWVAA